MLDEVRDAIESARSVGRDVQRLGLPARRHSHDLVRAVVLAVVRELPDDMTIGELRDELEIAQPSWSKRDE
ncbi:MAG: hypothetical protein ACM31O_03410 [Bacteroidota bacterium]